MIVHNGYIGNYHSSHQELRWMALSSVQPIPYLQDIVSLSKESLYRLSLSDLTAISSVTVFQSTKGEVGTHLGVPLTLHLELPLINSTPGEPGEQLGSITMFSIGTSSVVPQYGTGKIGVLARCSGNRLHQEKPIDWKRCKFHGKKFL